MLGILDIILCFVYTLVSKNRIMYPLSIVSRKYFIKNKIKINNQIFHFIFSKLFIGIIIYFFLIFPTIVFIATFEILWQNDIALELKKSDWFNSFKIVDYCGIVMGFIFISLNCFETIKFKFWQIENNKLSDECLLGKVINSKKETSQVTFNNSEAHYVYKVYSFDITQYLTNKNAVFETHKYVGYWITASRYLQGNDYWKYLLILLPTNCTILDGKRIELYSYRDFYNKYFSNMQ
ncbi:hypothetical protein [Mycoplasma sp. 1932B]|uniref:hypothetical protein n=2 Tax=unclassified Mycoplasma TaxID=2683645 RepID=UPI003AB056B4